MDINNKLKLDETKDGEYVLYAENENYLVAQIMDATPEIPETAARARRIVECYNLFAGIASPTEHMQQLKTIAVV